MRVVILNSDYNSLLFDIYEESGQMLEIGFESEESAKLYAIDQKWEVLNIIHIK